MLVPCEVQAVPVAITPLEHTHTFWVHTRLVDAVQSTVCLVPVVHDPLQDLHDVLVCPLVF